jgi:NitT/TauT family transport system ATP-binding protein
MNPAGDADDLMGDRVLVQSPAPIPAIDLKNVGLSFESARLKQQIVALKDINLEVPDGLFMSLLGPSGCGKTTLLRIVDGLLAPREGTVRVLGAPPKPGPDMGFVFQSFRLIPWLTVLANIEFPLGEQGISKQERTERALEQLNLVGLSRFKDAYPDELSGGMKQRVALARALVTRPRVLLMDEPFASIDAQTRELMQMELMRIWSQQRPTVLFVTHSVDEAIVLSDRIALMGPRPGRIVETLDVDLDRPRWEYDARADSRYIKLRAHLSARMRELVLSDPQSDFYRAPQA